MRPASDLCLDCGAAVNPVFGRQELVADAGGALRRRCGACVAKYDKAAGLTRTVDDAKLTGNNLIGQNTAAAADAAAGGVTISGTFFMGQNI